MEWCALITNLFSESGHDFEYHRSFRDVIHRLNAPYSGYINQKHTLSHMPSDWHGWFTKEKRSRFKHLIPLFFALAKLFRKKKSHARCFFWESFTFSELIVFALAIFIFFRKKDRVSLLIRYEKFILCKWPKMLLAFLKWKLKRRFILLSDSARIANSSKHTIHVVPIPHTAGLDFGKIQKPKTPIKLWWAGPPRSEKGITELKKLIQSHSQESFKLYVTEELRLETKVATFYLKKNLTRQEYLEQMSRVDVILLPYDPVAYFYRTSGIFVETIFAGKIPFVREGSWLANELLEHDLGELIIKWDSLDEIARISRDPQVLKRLKSMQQFYHHYHSVDHYAKLISRHHADSAFLSSAS